MRELFLGWIIDNLTSLFFILICVGLVYQGDKLSFIERYIGKIELLVVR